MEDERTTAKKTARVLCQRQRGALRVPAQPKQRLRARGTMEEECVGVCVCLRYPEIYQVISQQHYLSYRQLSPHQRLQVSHAAQPCCCPTPPPTFSL